MFKHIIYTGGGGWKVLCRHKHVGDFQMQLSIGSTIPKKLAWGDGTFIDVSGPNAYTRHYTLAGEKIIRVSATLNDVSNLGLQAKNLTYIDFSVLENLRGIVYFYDNPDLVEAKFGTSSGTVSRMWGYRTGLKRMDFSRMSGFGGDVRISSNDNLEEMLIGASTNGITLWSCGANPKLKKVNLSGVTGLIRGNFQMENCFELAEFLAGPNMQVDRFWMTNTKLNIVFPFGTSLFSTDIRLNNSGITTTNVNANIANIYNTRTDSRWRIGLKPVNFGGNNQPATGIKQAPAGYVQGGADGSPATAKEMVFVLENQTNPDGTLKYGFSFTIN